MGQRRSGDLRSGGANKQELLWTNGTKTCKNSLRGRDKSLFEASFTFKLLFIVGCNTSRDQKSVQRAFYTAPSRQKQGTGCRHPVQKYGLDVRGAERSSKARKVWRSSEERSSKLEVGALLLPQGQEGRTSRRSATDILHHHDWPVFCGLGCVPRKEVHNGK